MHAGIETFDATMDDLFIKPSSEIEPQIEASLKGGMAWLITGRHKR